MRLIDAGQAVSPSVASAAARIGQARAVQVGATAALLPALSATASSSRNSAQPGFPLSTIAQGALQASWEIDVFGARRFAQDSACARLAGAQAGWHDARVSVAADIGNQYYGLRACQQLLAITRADATSRADTARLSQLSAEAGFTATATAALARASAAEASGRVTQQQAQCDISVKTLVALTALAEPELRQQLALAAPASLTMPVAVTSLPAATLSQRPDVFNAEREVAAASAAVGNAQAQRYPRLTLGGSIGAGAYRAFGVTTDAPTWAIGPLAVSLPLFDAGTRVANIAAARASYDEAVALYRARVRQAVREVEQPRQHRPAQRRCHARRRWLPTVLRWHRKPLPQRSGQPGRTRRCATPAAGRRTEPGNAATATQYRMDRAVSRRRRWLARTRRVRQCLS